MSEPKQLDIHEIMRRMQAGESLEGEDLSGMDLTGMEMPIARLGRAKCQKTSFLKANLSFADFKEADLQGAFMIGANLKEANFSDANLEGADLYLADLSHARFKDANLKNANLEQTYCNGTDFSGADLHGARLNKADMVEANLTNANLERADLSETKLPLPPEQQKSWMVHADIIREYLMQALIVLLVMIVGALLGYIVRLTYSNPWVMPTSILTGMVFGLLIVWLRSRTEKWGYNIDRHYYPAYFGIIVIGMFFGGIIGSIYSAILNSAWIVPGSMAIGFVVSTTIVYFIERITNASVDGMLGRVIQQDYSETAYRGDMVYANNLFRQGRHEEALEAFLEIIKHAPDKAEPRYKTARIYHVGIKDYENAAKEYQFIIDNFTARLGTDNMYIIESNRAIKQLK